MKVFYYLLLLILLLIQCEPKKNIIKIGAHIWIGYEPMFIYSHLLDTKKNIHIIENSSASRTMRALQNNIIDIGMITMDEAILLKQSVKELKVIYLVNFSNGADAMLSQNNIKYIQDIKGKNIGVENTALGAFFLQRILEIHNIALSEITIIPLEISQHKSAFEKNIVDVLVTYEPTKTILMKSGANLLFDSSQIPGEILDVLVTKESVIQNQRDKLIEILKGFENGLTMLNSSDPKAIEIIKNRERITELDLKKMLSGIKILNIQENKKYFSDMNHSKNIKLLADSMLKNNLISDTTGAGSLLDSTIIESIHE